MTEEQQFFCFWYEQLTGSTIEELCTEMEVPVDYFMEEFVV